MWPRFIHYITNSSTVLFSFLDKVFNKIMVSHLENANPVLLVWLDELREGIVTLQCSMRQVALANILEDDMGKV